MEEIYWKPDVYADIPTPYAVFKVLLSDDGTSVENTQYVYVNQAYCHSAKCRREDLLGRCFFDVYQRGDMRWLEYCWQALTTGQAVHDSIVQLQQHPGSLGVIFIDLNGLKAINDHQGHLAGDTALQAVASLLSECFGADDTYRTGGDEFVIFLPAISQADFRGQLPRLRNYIARHSQLSLAVGGQWTEDTAHILETIHVADNAMYRDKEAYYRRIHRKQHHHPVVK